MAKKRLRSQTSSPPSSPAPVAPEASEAPEVSSLEEPSTLEDSSSPIDESSPLPPLDDDPVVTDEIPPDTARLILSKDDLLRIIRNLESMVPDPVRRAAIDSLLSTALSSVRRDDGVLRQILERNLPKEAVGFVVSSADATRKELLRVVSRETRDFLGSVNFSRELSNVLTSLSFEVTLRMGFVPRERKSKESEVIRAEVQRLLEEWKLREVGQGEPEETDSNEAKASTKKARIIKGLRAFATPDYGEGSLPSSLGSLGIDNPSKADRDLWDNESSGIERNLKGDRRVTDTLWGLLSQRYSPQLEDEDQKDHNNRNDT